MLPPSKARLRVAISYSTQPRAHTSLWRAGGRGGEGRGGRGRGGGALGEDLVVVGLVVAELRGVVVRGADHGGSHVGVGGEDFGDAKVAHFHDAVAREEDVLGLDVAVHDALAVDVGERGGDLHKPIQNLGL